MSKSKKGAFWIGTSGVAIPGNKQTFPEEFRQKSRLNYYSSWLNSLEINSSFYKVPMPATFEKWSNDVPEHFRFTVKLWKEITHIKELKFDPGDIKRFLDAAKEIGSKKGCILVQLPGKISFDYYTEVEEILQRLMDHSSSRKWSIAVEFRNASWYTSETFELLDEYGASLVIHDIPKGKNLNINKGANCAYIRYHGPNGDYRGSYSKAFLKEQSVIIKKWLKAGKDVYAYFNNTIGTAFDDALALKKMVTK